MIKSTVRRTAAKRKVTATHKRAAAAVPKTRRGAKTAHTARGRSGGRVKSTRVAPRTTQKQAF
ncbi:MAG TPA: hypothetical protein VK663_07260, partial [Burkholderiales bacterium]|nr:hypothetical protein [Burkholderiales bacterium]